MNSKQRAKIAEHTLTILEDGGYINFAGKKVDISEQVRYAVNKSKLYSPDRLKELEDKVKSKLNNKNRKDTVIEVNNETTLQAARRLKIKENFQNVACLNFASAKNPGGGFLNGSSAQEESLARSSALYPCIKQMNEMYDANREYNSALYLNYMIYSPQVPVFRNDQGCLLDQSYKASFITAPAVNAGVVRSRESKENIEKIGELMRYRIEKILSLALIHENEALVLGAFGCGVFKNDPEEVAQYFKQFVVDDRRFNNSFDKIVFAVLDRSKNKGTYNIFKRKIK